MVLLQPFHLVEAKGSASATALKSTLLIAWNLPARGKADLLSVVGLRQVFEVSAFAPGATPGSQARSRGYTRFLMQLHWPLTQCSMQVDQETLWEKYRVSRDKAHALQEQAAKRAGMVAGFCSRMHWDFMEHIFSRLQACTPSSLVWDVEVVLQTIGMLHAFCRTVPLSCQMACRTSHNHGMSLLVI